LRDSERVSTSDQQAVPHRFQRFALTNVCEKTQNSTLAHVPRQIEPIAARAVLTLLLEFSSQMALDESGLSWKREAGAAPFQPTVRRTARLAHLH
jgi:hypothetical protein